MPEEITKSRKRTFLYIIGFVFNLSYAIPNYINSSFLADAFKNVYGDKTTAVISIIYAASSIATLFFFTKITSFLKRFGNFKVTLWLIVAEMLSLISLAFVPNIFAVVCAFIVNFFTIALINFTIDLFLEEFSSDTNTGNIRGTFLTVVNSAWLVAPIIGFYILDDFSYPAIYILSAILLLPTLYLVFKNLREIQDPLYTRVPFWKSFAEIWADKNVKSILIVQFLLQFFYAWMTIYMPVYLLSTMGFSATSVGIILSVILLPFVLTEKPLGWLADKKYGEKEMLSIGFVIVALATAMIALVTDHNIYIWIGVLFLSRIGAAMIEVMSDTYFFKQIDATKAHYISFSRMARPLATVLSSLIAFILLLALDMKGLFIFLSLFMLYGLRYSLTLADTK